MRIGPDSGEWSFMPLSFKLTGGKERKLPFMHQTGKFTYLGGAGTDRAPEATSSYPPRAAAGHVASNSIRVAIHLAGRHLGPKEDRPRGHIPLRRPCRVEDVV
jgi:hypothetical protein